MAKWPQVEGMLQVTDIQDKSEMFMKSVPELVLLPSSYHTLLFALLSNTNNILHDLFLDTTSSHKIGVSLYLCKRSQPIPPARRYVC